MKHTHIPLLDYIDIDEEQCDLYVHTRDTRILVFKDVQSNVHIDDTGLYVDYLLFSSRMTAFVLREDFSHLEYKYSLRDTITKQDFDELNSFIEKQLGDDLI